MRKAGWCPAGPGSDQWSVLLRDVTRGRHWHSDGWPLAIRTHAWFAPHCFWLPQAQPNICEHWSARNRSHGMQAFVSVDRHNGNAV